MSDLKTRFWVDALRWRAESGGAAIYVARRGDPDAGAVLVKVSLLDGTARLFVPVTDFSGERVWSQPLGDSLEEARADAYAARRLEDDPDLWVIEIEDRHGRHFLTEPVEKS
ncbi:DUF1491 family protein [Marinicauda algicola]|uniref:DUF1491 family protein n=1 Tax=Marinicauda algicola TaxID=2029849 RepID=A0A4S2H048_9PROT|nr:DUF1491 family protein [Marinicauda algicola]TGY88551.1 DUF1491 family protein [Marinicauda algicola]